MDAIKDILENIWVQRGIWAFAVVIFSGLIYLAITKFLSKKEQQGAKYVSEKKNKTFIRMLKSIVGYLLATVTILMVLQIYGVDVSSMLAGVGILGIIIGLALQDGLKDIFRGFDIVSDNYYAIGDVITFGENTGQVVSITLRTTKIKDINTNNIVSIANRNINQVETISDAIYLNIPMPYEVPLKKADEILSSIIPILKKDKDITNAEYKGLNKLNDSSMDYLFMVNCSPTQKLQVRRKALHVIISTLEENKISIPYPQLVVHSKK